jgi:hypothetical protein
LKGDLKMKKDIPVEIIVGQMQKGRLEMVQVVKKRLSGIEYIHAPAYRIGGGKSEKGLCLTAAQWDELIALVEQAKAVTLPKQTPRRKMPAMKNATVPDMEQQAVTVKSNLPAMR